MGFIYIFPFLLEQIKLGGDFIVLIKLMIFPVASAGDFTGEELESLP